MSGNQGGLTGFGQQLASSREEQSIFMPRDRDNELFNALMRQMPNASPGALQELAQAASQSNLMGPPMPSERDIQERRDQVDYERQLAIREREARSRYETAMMNQAGLELSSAMQARLQQEMARQVAQQNQIQLQQTMNDLATQQLEVTTRWFTPGPIEMQPIDPWPTNPGYGSQPRYDPPQRATPVAVAKPEIAESRPRSIILEDEESAD